MNIPGKVLGFCSYSPQIMEQMKKDLNIDMPLQALFYCANHYRTQEKRDPYIEELKMLDQFVTSQSCSANFWAPTELLTNDDFVARTYADMLQKRSALLPNAKHPCTLAEAFSIADAYLDRAGKPRALPSLLALIEAQDHYPTSAAESNCAVSPNAAFRIRALTNASAPGENGDLLVLLLPVSKSKKDRYGLSISALLNTAQATDLMKQIYTVTAGGLLGTLLGIGDGFQIDLSRLSTCKEDVPFTILTGFYEGECLACVSPKNYEALYKAAQANNVRAIAFASISNEAKFHFIYNEKVQFTLHSSFLRAMFPIRPVTARLADEKADELVKSDRNLYGAASRSYIQSDKSRLKSDIYAFPNALCAAACAEVSSSYFINAVLTLSAPILSLAASGADFDAQRLVLGLELPQSEPSPELVGECLSTILGAYRLQAELAIPSTSSTIKTKDGLDHPHITAFALSCTAAPIPSSWTAIGNRVYCLAPKMQDNGLPVFESLRKLLGLLSSLRKKDVLKSAHVLCCESVTDGLLHMNTEAMHCRIFDHRVVTDGQLPLAILIETTEAIDAQQIGRIEQHLSSSCHVAAPVVPTESQSLVWSPSPSVTVIAKLRDTAAQMLTATLVKKGADAELYSDSANDSNLLSRAILTSQTLILCGAVTLKKTPQMKFAIDCFGRSGGKVFLLKNAKWEADGEIIPLPNGISEQLLAKICGEK